MADEELKIIIKDPTGVDCEYPYKEQLRVRLSDGTKKVYSLGGGAGSAVVEKDINFFDYEGTLLYSYTTEEANTLTELPALPEREGLICQGWNYSLETIQSAKAPIDVGAMYITDDGKTRVYIENPSEQEWTKDFIFAQSIANGVIVDWGDGSEPETFNDVYSTTITASHTYKQRGEYIVTFDVADGCKFYLGKSSNYYPFTGSIVNSRVSVRKIHFGKGDLIFTQGALYETHALTEISFPQNVLFTGTDVLDKCYSLRFVTVPYGIKSDISIANCYSLRNISLPEGLTWINSTSFYNDYALRRVTIPKTVTTIGDRAFSSVWAARIFDFSDFKSIPTLQGTGVFSKLSGFLIKVPAALLDEWKAATNWSTYADYIVGV